MKELEPVSPLVLFVGLVVVLTCSYSDVSIFVWSNLACIDETFGRAGLMASTTCLSVRAIGTVLLELTDSAIDMWLPVGDVGVHGIDSSILKKGNSIECQFMYTNCIIGIAMRSLSGSHFKNVGLIAVNIIKSICATVEPGIISWSSIRPLVDQF